MPGLGRLCLMALASGAFFLPFEANSQTVRGRVLEEGTGKPVEGAVIELVAPGGSNSARGESDGRGRFSVQAATAGVFTLRLTHPFFAASETGTVPLGPGEVLVVELWMGRRVIALAPLVVTARSNARLGGFYDRLQQPGFGRFLTRVDIDSRPSTTRTTDILRGIPGLEIVPVRSRGGVTGHMILARSGAGRCEPTIILDGTPVRQLPDSGIDVFLKPNMVEGVEVYPRGTTAPPDLPVSFSSCGVVAFWTRTGTTEGGTLTMKRVLTAGALFAGLVLFILLGRS